MKKNIFSFSLLLTTSLFLAQCAENKPVEKATEKATTTTPTNAELVKKGEYLVAIAGCNDCHSAKKMGLRGPEIIPETQLGGFPATRPIVKFDSKLIKEGFAQFYPDLTAAAGPWGISFAGNITSDETGIGNWSEAQFKKALTQGKLKGLDNGRMLLPPMPWANYVNMKDEDVSAIFAYLKSTKPVSNIAPAPIPPTQ